MPVSKLQQGNMGGSSKDWKREASPVSNPSLSRPHARVSRVFEVHMLTGVFSSLSYLILYSPLRRNTASQHHPRADHDR